MKKSVEGFIYPNELLREKSSKLVDRYVDDYGEEYQSIIKNRMNNTLYVFDSNPIVTMDFVKERESEIGDSSFLRRAEKEYKNYVKIKDTIHARLRKKYYNKLALYFSIPTYPIRDEILNLDIEAYNYHNVYKANKENDWKVKKRQEDYCRQCYMLGVKPIKDPTLVHFLLNEKVRLKEQEILLLVKNTNWGKRLYKTMKRYYPKISWVDVAALLDKEDVAYTAYLLNDRGIPNARIVYYPLLENLVLKDLDGIFYHENRHVIESTGRASGLHAYRSSSYRLLNEIHTEKNALLDKKCFSKDFLWSSDDVPSEYCNLYAELFPYTASFFEDNREFLNDCAVRGDFDSLEKRFGTKNLIEYEHFLSETASELKKSRSVGCDDDKLEKGNILIKKMQIK